MENQKKRMNNLKPPKTRKLQLSFAASKKKKTLTHTHRYVCVYFDLHVHLSDMEHASTMVAHNCVSAPQNQKKKKEKRGYYIEVHHTADKRNKNKKKKRRTEKTKKWIANKSASQVADIKCQKKKRKLRKANAQRPLNA